MIYAVFLSKNKSNVLQTCGLCLVILKMHDEKYMQTFRKYHFDFEVKQQKQLLTIFAAVSHRGQIKTHVPAVWMYCVCSSRCSFFYFHE